MPEKGRCAATEERLITTLLPGGRCCRGLLLLVHQPVALGLLGKLLLDLAHLGKPERPADARGIDVVLGRKHHRHQYDDGGDDGDDG